MFVLIQFDCRATVLWVVLPCFHVHLLLVTCSAIEKKNNASNQLYITPRHLLFSAFDWIEQKKFTNEVQAATMAATFFLSWLAKCDSLVLSNF